MIFKTLMPTLSIASQSTEADVAQAARDGFRAIVNNRSDGEDATQLQSIKIAHLAAQHGMEYAFVPCQAKLALTKLRAWHKRLPVLKRRC